MEPDEGLDNKQDEVKEIVNISSAEEVSVSSGETTEMERKPVSDNNSQDKLKKNKAMIVGMIILAILAVGGIGFGIFSWAAAFTNASKYTEEVMTNAALRDQLAEMKRSAAEEATVIDVDTEEISDELAQNLINPYMGTFTYLNDIFDHEFNENTKFYIAFKNMSFDWFGDFGKSAIGADTATVWYHDINDKYKYLFGEGKDLDRTNYQEGYNTFTYVVDNSGAEKFVVERLGGGGTMSALYSIIKDAYYSDEYLVVEVYHDKINVCVIEGADPNYCVKDMGYHTLYDDEMERIIDNNEERVPVYAMIFENAGDHYYLSAINKL